MWFNQVDLSTFVDKYGVFRDVSFLLNFYKTDLIKRYIKI